MRMQNAGNSKLYLIVGVLVALAVVLIFFISAKKREPGSFLGTILNQTSEWEENQAKLTSQVLVQTDDTVERVDIVSGKIESASALEREDFSDFVGFPKLGEDGKEDVSQSFVLVSQDNTKAIVVVSVFDQAVSMIAADAAQPLLRSSEFVCKVAEKKCETSELFSQNYQGLDGNQSDSSQSIWWSEWDSEKNLLYGNLSDEGVGDASPVYICDTGNKTCQKTAGADSFSSKEMRAVVPTGAYNPTLEKFVMINQYDKPNEQTGKRWELLYYKSDDLSQPALKYDVSLAIDGSENVFYDSVQSVSWSQDEKKIAIATSHKIVILDFTTGKLQFVYDAPFDEEEEYLFDGSALIYSEDGRFIIFADTEEYVVGENSDEEQEVNVVNVIKKIDLTKNNEVSELMRGNGLTLK